MNIYPDRQSDVPMTWGAVRHTPKIGQMWTDGTHAFLLLKHSPRAGNLDRYICYFPQLDEYHDVAISRTMMAPVDSWVT